MNASRQAGSLIGVAALALYLGHSIRMWILLDAGMAIVAFQAAVDAVAEGLAVHRHAVPCGILHARVPMARQAIRLRGESAPGSPTAAWQFRQPIFHSEPTPPTSLASGVAVPCN